MFGNGRVMMFTKPHICMCWIPALIVGDAMEIIVVDLEASNFICN